MRDIGSLQCFSAGCDDTLATSSHQSIILDNIGINLVVRHFGVDVIRFVVIGKGKKQLQINMESVFISFESMGKKM